jgi:hypothetical protein
MIRPMPPRWVLAVVSIAFACGGTSTDPKEPRTAKQKQLQEARASGEIDSAGNKWAGWRYQGDRGDCFYVFGRKCYKSEESACKNARCKSPAKCTSVGAGPAIVSCKESSRKN